MFAFAIGDADMITGFRLVGVEGIEVASVEEARSALSKAFKTADVALIIIGEEFSTQMKAEIDRLRLSQIKPLIVEVPGRLGPSGKIVLTDMMSKALGIKV